MQADGSGAEHRLQAGLVLPHQPVFRPESVRDSKRIQAGAGIGFTAHATTVIRALRAEADSLRFVTADDGCGFAPSGSPDGPVSNPASGRGHGLRTLLARLRDVGEIIEIRSNPGRGTPVTVPLPQGLRRR